MLFSSQSYFLKKKCCLIPLNWFQGVQIAGSSWIDFWVRPALGSWLCQRITHDTTGKFLNFCELLVSHLKEVPTLQNSLLSFQNINMNKPSPFQGFLVALESKRCISDYMFFIFFFICGGFCHTLKWNSHGFTCVPHPNPPSHLPLHPIPLGLPSAPGLSACLMHPTWAADLFHPR